jgi:hypothetical protein
VHLLLAVLLQLSVVNVVLTSHASTLLPAFDDWMQICIGGNGPAVL